LQCARVKQRNNLNTPQPATERVFLWVDDELITYQAPRPKRGAMTDWDVASECSTNMGYAQKAKCNMCCPGTMLMAMQDELEKIEEERRQKNANEPAGDDGADGETRKGNLFDVMEPDEDAFCGRRHGTRYV